MVIELFLIGVGLSMDAFAVSVCKGLGMEKSQQKSMRLLIGIVFRRISGTDAVSRLGAGESAFRKYITCGRITGSPFSCCCLSVERW